VHRNEWFLPSAQSVYVTDLGPVVQQGMPIATGGPGGWYLVVTVAGGGLPLHE
jgi:hypothetical protein